jgi:hypothetical protein
VSCQMANLSQAVAKSTATATLMMGWFNSSEFGRPSAYRHALLFLKFYDPRPCFIGFRRDLLRQVPDAGDRLRHNCRA